MPAAEEETNRIETNAPQQVGEGFSVMVALVFVQQLSEGLRVMVALTFACHLLPTLVRRLGASRLLRAMPNKLYTAGKYR